MVPNESCYILLFAFSITYFSLSLCHPWAYQKKVWSAKTNGVQMQSILFEQYLCWQVHAPLIRYACLQVTGRLTATTYPFLNSNICRDSIKQYICHCLTIIRYICTQPIEKYLQLKSTNLNSWFEKIWKFGKKINKIFSWSVKKKIVKHNLVWTITL